MIGENSSMPVTSRVSWKASDAALGYLVLRLTIGMNILMHGSMRLLTGDGKFAATMSQPYQGTLLPVWFAHGFGMVLPWIEATIGFLVFTGLLTRVALTAGGILMMVLTFGVGIRQNWETAGLQLSYALVFGLLLATVAFNRYSVDSWLRRGKS